MKNLLKNAREAQQLKPIEVSRLLHIDAALVSKFESGSRMPTYQQMQNLAILLKIDRDELETAWLKEKILNLVSKSDVGIQALQATFIELGAANTSANLSTPSIEKLMAEMETLKAILTAPKK